MSAACLDNTDMWLQACKHNILFYTLIEEIKLKFELYGL